MKTIYRYLVIISFASLSTLLFAQTNWQSFMPSLNPGMSKSQVLAELPQDILIKTPASNISPNKARWSGNWRGWACRDQVCDIRLVVEKVGTDGATIIYSVASSTQNPFYARAEAKFVEDELQATLANGAAVAYRFRKTGDIEFHYQRNADWMAGILSKEK